jgi:hypothetical protein
MAELLLAPLLLVSRCRTCAINRRLLLRVWLHLGACLVVLLVYEQDAPALLLHAGDNMLCCMLLI